jgi:putative IMPACT (imprinted ancient) family translation regulator
MLLVPEKEVIFEESVLSSRFIAVLSPLLLEADFPFKQKELQSRYPKASHYPYAYKVLSSERMSDDGEPPRSVGVSLLSLLEKKELSYASLFVVRYFGGTKLGLGRLSRTYRETAERCLKEARFAEILPGEEIELLLPYPFLEPLKREASLSGLQLQVLDYGEKIRLLLRGDAKIIESLLAPFSGKVIERKKDVLYQRSLSL